MTDSFLQVTSFDPLIVANPGPTGPAGPAGPPASSLTAVGTKTADYFANPNEAVLTDNTVNGANITITLPPAPKATDRVAVDTVAIVPPNATIIACSAGMAFEDGSTAKSITVPGMGFECEYLGNLTWRARASLVPSAVAPLFDPSGSAQAVADTLTPQIVALQNRPQPASRSAQKHIVGALTLGFLAGGLEITQGFTALSCVAELDVAADADIHIDAYVGGVVVYTFVITAGSLSSTDTNPNSGSGVALSDTSYVTFKVTQCGSITSPGINLTLAFSETAGAKPVPSVGTIGNLTATALPQGFELDFGYQAQDANDELDHFAIRYLQGASAPTSLSQGTVLPDVSGVPGAGNATGYTSQTTGLPAVTEYSATVWPVGADGLLGSPVSVSVTTLDVDHIAPTGGAISLSPSPTAVTITITEPTDSDYAGGYLRRNNLTLTAPTTVTSNRPALQGYPGPAVGTAGTWIPKGTTVVVDSGLPSSSNWGYSIFWADTSGNVQTTPISASTTTLAAPTGTQGQDGLVPATATYSGKTFTFSQDYTQNFSGGNSILDTFGGTDINVEGPSYRNQSEGPAEPTNVDVITDPDDNTNQILRMRNRLITNGFYNSNYWSYKADWADNVTTGTGWYGSRLQVNGHYIQYGALQFRCRIGDANGNKVTSASYGGTLLANNVKGGNFMWYTDQKTIPGTAWPQDELDLWEVFSAGQAQINNHCHNTTGASNTNQQCNKRWNLDITQWTWVTCLIEPPPAGTNANGRLRVWYKQTGVDLGSGVGVPLLAMDTNKPYVGSNMGVPAGATAANADVLLQPQASKFVGLSLEYSGYWQDTAHTIKAATFSAVTGAGANQRQSGSFVVDSITLWNAVAS